MEYKYFNQFYLSTELAQSISNIISLEEKKDYVCKSIIINIPEHIGESIISPIKSCNGYDNITEKYGKYVDSTISSEDYSFLVVIDNNSLEILSKFSFKSYDEIKNALDVLTKFNIRYDGIFDSKPLIERFPYLQEYFDSLDKWRSETGRVTIDKGILDKSLNKVLHKNKIK